MDIGKERKDMPLNIIISGTNFWNPGDDFVRDGTINILKELFKGEHINFHFFNFNEDFFPLGKFKGISNTLSSGDLQHIRDSVDYIVVAGLAIGHEVDEFYGWILQNDLQDRVLCIGGGYDSINTKVQLTKSNIKAVIDNARILIGRTEKRPSYIDKHNLPYVRLTCPSLLSVRNVIEPTYPDYKRIGFSIQLPLELGGIKNQKCDKEHYNLCGRIFNTLRNDGYEVSIVAHHKFEYFTFLNTLKDFNTPVYYSSFYTDLKELYRSFDAVISTRLHACLFANANGIPSIIINNTERHTSCIEGIPIVRIAGDDEESLEQFNKMINTEKIDFIEKVSEFKKQLMNDYLKVLKNVL